MSRVAYRPSIGASEVAEVSATLRSGMVANGVRAERFEERVAVRVGAPDALAVSSGTAALHCALLALGAGPGDEVLTTAVTCVATLNAIDAVGATPVLVDVEPDTLTMDPARVAAAVTSRAVAILPVHYAGHPTDIDGIQAVARRHGLAVVDDAAHALGATHRGRPVGSTADLTVFSFSGTKLITTGEGGMLAGRGDLVASARRWASHGTDPRGRRAPWRDSVQCGLKLTMSDVAASLGLAQLARLDEFLSRRREISKRYTEELACVPELRLPVVRREAEPAWHLYTVRTEDRDGFLSGLRARGIGAEYQFRPAHQEPYYRGRLGDACLPVTEKELATNFSLPLYPAMTDGDVDKVVCAARATAERRG